MAISLRTGPNTPRREKLKTLPTLSSLKHAFISRANRFVYQYTENPGPGSYDSPTREKHSGDYHVQREQASAIPKQHQWIVSKGRQPFQIKVPFESLADPLQGEGGSKQNHSSWAKNMRFNYDKLEQKDSVGPGKYNPQSPNPKQRSRTLPIKQRSSPQTYLNSILEQTRKHRRQHSALEEQLLQMKIKAIEIGKVTIKPIKQVPSFVFKSNSKRLYSEKQLNYVGPGSYNLQTSPIRIKKPALRKSQMKLHDRSQSSLLDDQSTAKRAGEPPGPGSYEISKLQLDTHHKKAVLGLILKQQRFTSRGERPGPGPGEYMRKRFVHLQASNFQSGCFSPFAKAQQKHQTFGTSQRFESTHNHSPLGQYDLGYNDICSRLNRQKQHQTRIRPSKSKSNLPSMAPSSPSH